MSEVETFQKWAESNPHDIFIVFADPGPAGDKAPRGPVGFYSTPQKAKAALDRFIEKYPGERKVHIIPADFNKDEF